MTTPSSSLSPFTLGAMNFGGRTPKADALRILDRAYERGMRFVDTANLYNQGQSEIIVGEALARHPDLGVATKVGLNRVRGQPEGLSASVIKASVDASRLRLKREVIDLLYLHAPDPRTPLDETLGAVAELVREGSVKHWGVSNFASWQILELRHAGEPLGLAPPAVSQVLYNLLVRQLDVEYFRFTQRYPLHTTVYNPLAGGLLSGRHPRGGAAPSGSRFDKNAFYQRRYWTPQCFAHVEALSGVAREEGCTLVELAYAWLAARPGVDSILVGPGTVEHLDAALEACKRPLSSGAAAHIEKLHQDFLGTDATYAR